MNTDMYTESYRQIRSNTDEYRTSTYRKHLIETLFIKITGNTGVQSSIESSMIGATPC